MAYGQAGSPLTKRSVGDQRAEVGEAFGFVEGNRSELHGHMSPAGRPYLTTSAFGAVQVLKRSRSGA